jgi:hypothetical protein
MDIKERLKRQRERRGEDENGVPLINKQSDLDSVKKSIPEKEEPFTYTEIAKEIWNEKFSVAADVQGIHFSLENNEPTEQKRITLKDEAMDNNQPVFNCQMMKAGGDWEWPSIYFRCQLVKGSLQFEADAPFPGNISTYNESAYFVLIPPPEGGNTRLVKEPDGTYVSIDNNDADDVPELDDKAAWAWLEDYLKQYADIGLQSARESNAIIEAPDVSVDKDVVEAGLDLVIDAAEEPTEELSDWVLWEPMCDRKIGTYVNKVRNCLLNILQEEARVSEKDFKRMDELIAGVDKLCENPAFLERCQDFEANGNRPEMCAESLVAAATAKQGLPITANKKGDLPDTEYPPYYDEKNWTSPNSTNYFKNITNKKGSKQELLMKKFAHSEADIQGVIEDAVGRGAIDKDATAAEKRRLAVEFLDDIADDMKPDGDGKICVDAKKIKEPTRYSVKPVGDLTDETVVVEDPEGDYMLWDDLPSHMQKISWTRYDHALTDDRYEEREMIPSVNGEYVKYADDIILSSVTQNPSPAEGLVDIVERPGQSKRATKGRVNIKEERGVFRWQLADMTSTPVASSESPTAEAALEDIKEEARMRGFTTLDILGAGMTQRNVLVRQATFTRSLLSKLVRQSTFARSVVSKSAKDVFNPLRNDDNIELQGSAVKGLQHTVPVRATITQNFETQSTLEALAVPKGTAAFRA